MEKTCKACGEAKPADEFHKDRSKRDGLNAYCKPCQIARQREYQSRSPRNPAPEGMGRCQHCKEIKPRDEFDKSSSRYDGIDGLCKACRRARHGSWRKRNLDLAAKNSREWRHKNRDRSRDHALKQNYGLPLGAYRRMFQEQDGKCAICGTDKPGGRGDRFHVDHCHESGKVRGLLCHGCNISIGHFQHNSDLLRSAIRYLAERSAESGRAFNSREETLIFD